MPEEQAIIVTDVRLSREQLARLAQGWFRDMIKYVVDVRRGLIAAGGELHADGEALLLDAGSAQDDLWGANYYPGRGPAGCIEYTALINIRPARGNAGMEIGDPAIRAAVRDVTLRLLGEGEAL